MHDTRLNVARDQIAQAVLACRRSAHSEEARAYRARRQLEGEERIAVLVQRMVPAIASGVAFTINPVTGADELVINWIDGLGEALVSGRVTPRQMLLPKSDRSALATLVVAIERHYGAPQDVEWCHDGQRYWIVQSRPITTRLRSHDSRASFGGQARVRSHDSPARFGAQAGLRATEWTRANLAEVLPDQLSPQALELYEKVLCAGERRFFGRLMAPESELGPMVKAFHGRLYFNLSQLRRITATVGAAFADTLRSMGHAEQIQPEDEIARWPPIRDFVRALPDIVRLVYYDLRIERIFRGHQATTKSALARLAVDPRTLGDRDIRAMFDWWLAAIPDTLTAVFVMSSVQRRETFVRKACQRVGFPYERLVYPQLAAGERSVSTQQAIDLVALADVARRELPVTMYLAANDGTFSDYRTALAGTDFLEAFDQFLERYGHRGRYESDWALPRLHEDPAAALFAVSAHLHGPPQDAKAIADRQTAEAAGA
jgi:pyruvate,water dikinase